MSRLSRIPSALLATALLTPLIQSGAQATPAASTASTRSASVGSARTDGASATEAAARAASRTYAATYDWRTRELAMGSKLRAGKDAWLLVIGVNFACYSYRTDQKQQLAADTSDKSFIELLTGAVPKTSGMNEPAADVKLKEPKSGADAKNFLHNFNLLMPSTERFDDPSDTKEELARALKVAQELRRRTLALGLRANAAASRTAQRASSYERATKLLKGYADVECATNGGRGAPAAAVAGVRAAAIETAKGTITEIADHGLMTELDSVAASAAALRIDLATTQLDDRRTAFLYEKELKSFERATDAIVARADTNRTAIRALGTEAANLQVAVAMLTAGQRDEFEVFIPVEREAERVTITLDAEGAGGRDAVKGKTHKDEITLPVDRRHRFFVTTGVLFSGLKDHRYELTNRYRTVGDSVQTYRTFIDRDGSSQVAFAPVVLGNVTLGAIKEGDVALTLGLASRADDGKLTTDYLVGGSYSLFDRWSLTLGYHMGRVQKLAIGDPDEVAKGPVPEPITPNDAIVRRWRGALGASLSLRIR
jgi:hypothetical protein